MAKHPPGRLERVSKAWKQMLALRKKYDYPEFKSAAEVNDNWHVSYSMPHDALNALRRDAAIVQEGFGFIPWNQAPKG